MYNTYIIYCLSCAIFFLLTEELWKKKWKGLRDTYKREKNKEKDRCRSGAGLSASRPWKYFMIMGFLAPFVESRETSGNFSQLRRGGTMAREQESQAAAKTQEAGPEDLQESQQVECEEMAGNSPLTPQIPPRSKN